MPLTDRDLGQNIQRTRYLRGLTQTELARAVGLDRTAISRIEAGRRSVAATELALFSEAFGVDVQELMQPAPSPSPSPNLARMLLRAGPVTANDELQLVWFVTLVESIAAAEQGPALPQLNRRIVALSATAAGEPPRRAARRRLGVGPLAPITGLSGLLYRSGVQVATARFPSASRLAGCALALPNGRSAILANANHLASRQRFTVAHELAHLLFDVESPVSACDVGEIRPGPRSRAEQRADAFAAAFLLPKRVVAPLRGSSLDLERLQRIEAEYGVSHATTVHRLHELGILAEEEARVLRKLGGRAQPPRPMLPYRLVGESLACLVGDAGARRNGDPQGYDVAPDSDVVP